MVRTSGLRQGWRLLAVTIGVAFAPPAWATEPLPADDFAHPFVRVAPQGQVILNPHPDFDAPSPSRLALEALEPAAGADPTLGLDGTAVAGAKDCPVGGGWQVVVIRGGRSPDVVRGPTVAAVTPPGC